MIIHLRGFRAWGWSLFLAILVVAAVPAASEAGWLGFRNDLKGAIIVQTATPVKARPPLWGRPKTMQAGEIAWDVVLQPGLRTIKILDANQKPLYLGNIPCRGDMFFSIQADPVAGVKLVPIKAPMAPPGRGR